MTKHTHKAVLVNLGRLGFPAWVANCRCGREGQTAHTTKERALESYKSIHC